MKREPSLNVVKVMHSGMETADLCVRRDVYMGAVMSLTSACAMLDTAESTVNHRARRVIGEQTVLERVTVRTGEAVTVRQANATVCKVILVQSVRINVPRARTVMCVEDGVAVRTGRPATSGQDSATALRDSKDHSVLSRVRRVPMVTHVNRHVCVRTRHSAAQQTDPANVKQGGWVRCVRCPACGVSSVQTVIVDVNVTTERAVTPRRAYVTVRPVIWETSVSSSAV